MSDPPPWGSSVPAAPPAPSAPLFGPRPVRRLGRALRVHRRLRLGLVQLTYVLAAFALALLLPKAQVGSVPTASLDQFLFTMAAGIIPFLGLVYTLLFLVVQWGTSTFTPRLNLFRDDPVVWHSFGFFVGLVVFLITAGLRVAGDTHTTALIPVVAVLALLVALALFRVLITRAFASIQLASTLATVARRGRQMIDGLYPDELAADGVPDPAAAPELPSAAREVRWPGPTAVLQTIDVPRLMALAAKAGAVVELLIPLGAAVHEGGAVARVRGGDGGPSDRKLLEAAAFGPERTFAQDPGFALRVLVDIGLRALSPALNDPTTAVQALDTIDGLLRRLATRNLDVARISGSDGDPRIVLVLSTWDEYVDLAFDELRLAAAGSIQVSRRMVRVLDALHTDVPEGRRPPLRSQLDRIQAQSTALFPVLGDNPAHV